MYLGVTIYKMRLKGGNMLWKMLSYQYVKSAVTNVEDILARNGRMLPSKCVTPLSSKYSTWLEELL